MGDWFYIPIIFILMFLIWFWLKYPKTATFNKNIVPPLSEKQPKTYPGVTILTHSNACGAVSRFRGQRLLASEAPALPVMGCTTKECSCNYLRHKDRRSDEDRRYRSVTWENVHGESEKRTRGDRRRPRPSFA